MSYLTQLGEFHVDGFPLKSRTFVILLLVSLILSGFGYFFAFALPFIYFCYEVVYPGIYRRIMRFLIHVSNNRIVRLLSFIPKIDFNGEWFEPLVVEPRQLHSLADLKSFFGKHFWEISIIHLIFLTWGLRIKFETSTAVMLFYGITSSRLSFAAVFVPFMTGLYFFIIWTIKDTGLKLYRYTRTSGGGEREFEEITNLSESYKSLFGFFFGIPSLFWIVQQAKTTQFTPLPNLPSFVNVVILLLLLYFSTIGITLFSVLIYYRSRKYERIVNETREWIRDSSSDYQRIDQFQAQRVRSQYPQGGARVQASQQPGSGLQHNPPTAQPSQQQPSSRGGNKFCTGCGAKLQEGQKFCMTCGRRLNQ